MIPISATVAPAKNGSLHPQSKKTGREKTARSSVIVNDESNVPPAIACCMRPVHTDLRFDKLAYSAIQVAAEDNSPPYPMPWETLHAVTSIPPQIPIPGNMPVALYGGTNPIARDPKPMNIKDPSRGTLLPYLSPKCASIQPPRGLTRKPVRKTAIEKRNAFSGLAFGKYTAGHAIAESVMQINQS
jgi:hypothetical protein